MSPAAVMVIVLGTPIACILIIGAALVIRAMRPRKPPPPPRYNELAAYNARLRALSDEACRGKP